MSSAAFYARLSQKEGLEQEHTADHSSETPAFDEAGLAFGKKRENVSRYWYWILYFGTVAAMLGLFAGTQRSLQYNRRQCWDMFNFYCKRGVELVLHINI